MEAVRTSRNTNTVSPAAIHSGNDSKKEPSGSLFIQPKLTIGSPDDPLEKEADDMADKVMRMEMPSPINFSSAKNSVNRKCAHCEEEEKQMQRKESSNDSVSVAPPIVHNVINSSGGRSLDATTRSFMEPRFNYDFSSVKIHDSDIAAKSASSINALAYTSGNNIVFNSGQYNSNSDSGKKLLAHELTHVVQQGTNVATKIQRLGDLSKVPPMVCDVANTSPAGTVAFTALFPTSSTDLSPTQRSDIAIFVRSWQASGGTDVLRIDGYASTPGGDEMNWRLSCDRAFSIANELDLNGVPRNMVEFFAQGETSQFGGQLDNQRAEITMLAPAPAPPAPAPAPPAPAPSPPAPAPATSVVFSESPLSQFTGYDDSVNPNWLVVPVGENRPANTTITPAGAAPTFISDTPATTTVATTPTGILVTGVVHGTANINAMQGATVIGTLQIAVKRRIDRTSAIHYVCDSAPAAAGGPHCSNGTPSVNDMINLINSVWQRQANINYTDGGSGNVTAPGDLGTEVDWTPPGGEWNVVIALGTAGVSLNIFRVNHYTLQGVNQNDGGTLGTDILFGDSPCADGWGLTHEVGHSMGLGHGDAFIMTPCGGRLNQRVSKAMADRVNP